MYSPICLRQENSASALQCEQRARKERERGKHFAAKQVQRHLHLGVYTCVSETKSRTFIRSLQALKKFDSTHIDLEQDTD